MPRRPRDPGVPQSPADYFGTELRAYREAAGLSRPQFAELLGYTPQWIGQIEQGASAPSEDFAKDCDTYFQTNGTFHRLWKWIKLVDQLHVLPPGFSDFLKLEAKAVAMHKFEAMAVTGLFQTPAYAFEILREGKSAEDADRLVATRLERQEAITGVDAPGIVVILDEGAVRRPVGNRGVMREQMEQLVDLAGQPNITMQIVPSAKGAYPGVMGAFTLLEFDDQLDIAYIEGHVGGQIIERSGTVRAYKLRFDLIRGAALSADDSLKLLHAVLEGL